MIFTSKVIDEKQSNIDIAKIKLDEKNKLLEKLF
jgi:hypothetical protein